ncbi:MAG: alpha-E domain-containing protein [Clostridium sp.]
MGTISVDKANNLFWLGRYTERTFTTLREFHNYYDRMIDVDENIYRILCEKLMIPNIYTSKQNFIRTYLFDKNDINSIYSSMLKAFDNAVLVRNEISTDSLSYIQMALDKLQKSKESKMLLLDLLTVTDYLFAFWGSIYDNAGSDETKNIIDCGKYIERLDLYLRLSYDYSNICRVFSKLKKVLKEVKFSYNENNMMKIESLINVKDISDNSCEIIGLLSNVLTV